MIGGLIIGNDILKKIVSVGFEIETATMTPIVIEGNKIKTDAITKAEKDHFTLKSDSTTIAGNNYIRSIKLTGDTFWSEKTFEKAHGTEKIDYYIRNRTDGKKKFYLHKNKDLHFIIDLEDETNIKEYVQIRHTEYHATYTRPPGYTRPSSNADHDPNILINTLADAFEQIKPELEVPLSYDNMYILSTFATHAESYEKRNESQFLSGTETEVKDNFGIVGLVRIDSKHGYIIDNATISTVLYSDDPTRSNLLSKYANLVIQATFGIYLCDAIEVYEYILRDTEFHFNVTDTTSTIDKIYDKYVPLTPEQFNAKNFLFIASFVYFMCLESTQITTGKKKCSKKRLPLSIRHNICDIYKIVLNAAEKLIVTQKLLLLKTEHELLHDYITQIIANSLSDKCEDVYVTDTKQYPIGDDKILLIEIRSFQLELNKLIDGKANMSSKKYDKLLAICEANKTQSTRLIKKFKKGGNRYIYTINKNMFFDLPKAS